MDKKFDLDDISLVPIITSDINSRKECNPYYPNFDTLTTDDILLIDSLPIMASPMDTVVNTDNSYIYLLNNIIPCIPRGEKVKNDLSIYNFHSFGLSEIEKQLQETPSMEEKEHKFYNYKNILIDIANGHMQRLITVVEILKDKYPSILLMVGNVAHPLTYKRLAEAGADYVRCGIGTGNGCTTSANVGVNYPIGSLIYECRKIKDEDNLNTKIVIDGGMKGYKDIIKALALGADFCMVGSLFNKAIESAGDNYLFNIKVSQSTAKYFWKKGLPIYKKYRGMSTKEVQKKWGRAETVTSEGITKYQKVEYDISGWVLNFKDYLCSCMSYCGARTLDDFIGKVEWQFITNNSFKRFNK